MEPRQISQRDPLLERNELWSLRKRQSEAFFHQASGTMPPRYLWIGCSDCAHSEHELVGAIPGELLVHRNVGNVVSTSDPGSQAVLQQAIEVFGIERIIVVGHYGCSALASTLKPCCDAGLDSQWFGHLRNVTSKHGEALAAQSDYELQHELLCELNVIEQAVNVCKSPILVRSWQRKQPVTVHAWVYRPQNSRLADTGFRVSDARSLQSSRRAAIQRLIGARTVGGSADAEQLAHSIETLIEPLTAREKEVFQHLASGASNACIAGKLNISLVTVSSHLRNIYQKTGFTSRMQAVIAARGLSR